MSLFIYGDSFTEKKLNLNWTYLLSQKLNTQEINKAVGGGSTDRAFKLFTEDLQQKIFTDNDIIIFQCSNYSRIHLNYQNFYPSTASLFNFSKRFNIKNQEWLFNNKKYIKWYLINRDSNLVEQTHESYLHTLYLFAQNNPNIKIIVLYMTKLKNLTIKTSLSNFINFSNIELSKISFNEYIEVPDNRSLWLYKNIDFRINHLTIPNLNILSNIIYETLQSVDNINFNYDRFVKNIIPPINNRIELKSLVDLGYLYGEYVYMFKNL